MQFLKGGTLLYFPALFHIFLMGLATEPNYKQCKGSPYLPGSAEGNEMKISHLLRFVYVFTWKDHSDFSICSRESFISLIL